MGMVSHCQIIRATVWELLQEEQDQIQGPRGQDQQCRKGDEEEWSTDSSRDDGEEGMA